MVDLEPLFLAGVKRQQLRLQLELCEEEIQDLITTALETGNPWSAIGNALGEGRSNAHRRWTRRKEQRGD